jgi:glycerophosphoryl diester phosphodiesterase
MSLAFWKTLRGNAPRIIAHRGASGYRPEHSAEAFALAFDFGADAVEPDVLPSRDGVLFVRHDIDLGPSTDIASRGEFAARAHTNAGRREWWIGDFDAVELDALQCREPNPARQANPHGHSKVLRLSELLDMACAAGCAVDIELKDPGYFQSLGHDAVALLEAVLRDADALGAQAPVWLECFDHAVLRDLHARCGNRCFALVDAMPDAARLRELASWATGVAPNKALLWDVHGADSGLVAQAHAQGLEVHAWTFRDDAAVAPFASPAQELEAAFRLGVDALFCDFPDRAMAQRDALSVLPPAGATKGTGGPSVMP